MKRSYNNNCVLDTFTKESKIKRYLTDRDQVNCIQMQIRMQHQNKYQRTEHVAAVALLCPNGPYIPAKQGVPCVTNKLIELFLDRYIIKHQIYKHIINDNNRSHKRPVKIPSNRRVMFSPSSRCRSPLGISVFFEKNDSA